MNCSIGSRLRAFCIRGVRTRAVPVVQRAGGLVSHMAIGIGTTAFVDIWEPTQILQDPNQPLDDPCGRFWDSDRKKYGKDPTLEKFTEPFKEHRFHKIFGLHGYLVSRTLTTLAL